MKKIGVIGSRSRDDRETSRLVEEKIVELIEEGDILVSGGCPKGADHFAERIAKKYGIPILIYYPDWNKWDKGAPFLRNTDIANASDVLIAATARDYPDSGRGTMDTIQKFLERKTAKDVHIV